MINKDFLFNLLDLESEEEVYVKQPSSLEDHNFSNHVFKLYKILYGLKQAPCAWYERVNKFLIKNNLAKGSADTTLFLKKKMMTY